MKRITGIIIVMLLIAAQVAVADVPDSVNYQGILKSSGGSPVPDGSYDVIFKIYDVAAGPNPALWSETKSVTTVGGLFTTLLGSVTALPPSVFSGSKRFLGITVSPDPEMTPRTPLVAVPYAYRIATVDGAAGGSISGDVAVSGGNVKLDPSSATAGNILKGGTPFIHNYGTDNTFVGLNAGNLTMSGQGNTASGRNALLSNTSGFSNVAVGGSALFSNTTGHSNTTVGLNALYYNTTGIVNTAVGLNVLINNTTGSNNTAVGYHALASNAAGTNNTAIGYEANVSAVSLTNATAIGNGAIVNASNKIRLGNSAVTVIEGQVAYTFTSDKNQKENFKPVDGDEVLRKIRQLGLASWNYIGQDPQQFRHYGPVAQEFFAAFGHDDVGTSGTPTTINSGDMAGILMIAVQTLTRDNDELRKQIAELREMIRVQAVNQK